MSLNQTYSHPLMKKLDYYAILITLPLGLVGNLISFLIFIRPSLNKRTNTGFLYSILCVLNILTIIEFNLIAYSNVLLKLTFELPCRLEYFLRELLSDSLTWMQAMISLDRFVLIFFPGRANFMTKKVVNILNFNLKTFLMLLTFLKMILKWVLCLIMIGILGLIVITNSPILITYSVIICETCKPVISIPCQQTKQMLIANRIINILMRFYIPYTITICLNINSIVRLKKSKSRVIGTSTQQPGSSNNNRQSKFATSTLIIDLIHLVFNFPETVFQIYGFANMIMNNTTSLDDIVVFYYNLFSHLSFGYSVVFLAIFLVFNRIFRKEFLTFLRFNYCNK